MPSRRAAPPKAKSFLPPKGVADVRAYYKGTSLVFSMDANKTKTFIKLMESAVDSLTPAEVEESKALCLKQLDAIEAGLCAYSQKVGAMAYMFQDQDKMLKGAFPGVDQKDIITQWLSMITFGLKHKLFENDDNNGWLITEVK